MAGQADWWLIMAAERSETGIERYVTEVQRLLRWAVIWGGVRGLSLWGDGHGEARCHRSTAG